MYYIGSMAYDPNYLEHHGILGMKWGVRRYQNPDGSLTTAGQARYYKLSRKAEKARSKADSTTIDAHEVNKSKSYKAAVEFAKKYMNAPIKTGSKKRGLLEKALMGNTTALKSTKNTGNTERDRFSDSFSKDRRVKQLVNIMRESDRSNKPLSSSNYSKLLKEIQRDYGREFYMSPGDIIDKLYEEKGQRR